MSRTVTVSKRTDSKQEAIFDRQRSLSIFLFLSRMCVVDHNWSARKQRLHLQSVAATSSHSASSEDRIGQCGTSSGSCHKTQPVSRHFLLQAPQCFCSVPKRFSRDHFAEEGQNRIVGSHTGESWPPQPTSSYASIDF